MTDKTQLETKVAEIVQSIRDTAFIEVAKLLDKIEVLVSTSEAKDEIKNQVSSEIASIKKIASSLDVIEKVKAPKKKAKTSKDTKTKPKKKSKKDSDSESEDDDDKARCCYRFKKGENEGKRCPAKGTPDSKNDDKNMCGRHNDEKKEKKKKETKKGKGKKDTKKGKKLSKKDKKKDSSSEEDDTDEELSKGIDGELDSKKANTKKEKIKPESSEEEANDSESSDE